LTTRLKLICHASTAATRTVAFADDEAVDVPGLQKMARLPALALQRCLTSPTLRARQTAEALHCVATVDPALRDCDYGRWTGRALEAVLADEPQSLATWMADPAAAPHGGESVVQVIARIGAWLDVQAAMPGAVIAITHAAVIRAAIIYAIGAAPGAFGHIDIAPLSMTQLSVHNGRWTLSGIGPLGRL
jgi:broad specificity phosphatase PhoE